MRSNLAARQTDGFALLWKTHCGADNGVPTCSGRGAMLPKRPRPSPLPGAQRRWFIHNQRRFSTDLARFSTVYEALAEFLNPHSFQHGLGSGDLGP